MYIPGRRRSERDMVAFCFREVLGRMVVRCCLWDVYEKQNGKCILLEVMLLCFLGEIDIGCAVARIS